MPHLYTCCFSRIYRTLNIYSIIIITINAHHSGWLSLYNGHFDSNSGGHDSSRAVTFMFDVLFM